MEATNTPSELRTNRLSHIFICVGLAIMAVGLLLIALLPKLFILVGIVIAFIAMFVMEMARKSKPYKHYVRQNIWFFITISILSVVLFGGKTSSISQYFLFVGISGASWLTLSLLSTLAGRCGDIIETRQLTRAQQSAGDE